MDIIFAMSVIISRDVIFRDSEHIPIFDLPHGDAESTLDNNSETKEVSEPFDVEFVVCGDLDGDGKQELIFASIDGSLVIIKNRGQNQYHFRSPDKLPLDSMICGIDIAPIYHHDSGSPKSTANGIYVLTIDGTLLILSCEELKFLPSSPHYDYKCYDTSELDSGATRKVQKSIFTGVATLNVLLEVSVDLPLNGKSLRVIKNNHHNEATHSVIIAIGSLNRVLFFAYDLEPMRLTALCPDILVDAPVHSLDLGFHTFYSYTGEMKAVEATHTRLAVVGLSTGTVLCYELPSSSTRKATPVVMRADKAPPLPSNRPIGSVCVKMLPTSEYVGASANEASIFNQAMHFVVAWLDGRIAICSAEKVDDDDTWTWYTLLCLHTNQVLYKVDHFNKPLLDLPPAMEEQDCNRQFVSCAAISWSGATFLFTVRLPVVVLQRSEVKFGQNSVDEIVTEEGEEELDGEGKVLETEVQLLGGSKDGACESNAESVVEGERRKADGSTSVNESGDFAEEQPGLAEASFKDSHHHEHLDSAEFLKDRMSDHKLHVENVSSSTTTSTVVMTTRPDEPLQQFDNLVYFFDSRILTGASASRNFCCAQQGASQALVYISVNGMCTTICNVASQLKAFASKLKI